VKYTKYISHITDTCFGYLNAAIVRLYGITKKKGNLHKSYGRDLHL